MYSGLKSDLELSCNIEKISEGSLKNLYILNLKCENNFLINIDIPKEINIFQDNEIIKFVISKEKPQYTSNDFCAHGYVVTEKDYGNNNILTIISLFGLLVRVTSPTGLVKQGKLSVMDHIYLCIKKT